MKQWIDLKDEGNSPFPIFYIFFGSCDFYLVLEKKKFQRIWRNPETEKKFYKYKSLGKKCKRLLPLEEGHHHPSDSADVNPVLVYLKGRRYPAPTATLNPSPIEVTQPRITVCTRQLSFNTPSFDCHLDCKNEKKNLVTTDSEIKHA